MWNQKNVCHLQRMTNRAILSWNEVNMVNCDKQYKGPSGISEIEWEEPASYVVVNTRNTLVTLNTSRQFWLSSKCFDLFPFWYIYLNYLFVVCSLYFYLLLWTDVYKYINLECDVKSYTIVWLIGQHSDTGYVWVNDIHYYAITKVSPPPHSMLRILTNPLENDFKDHNITQLIWKYDL